MTKVITVERLYENMRESQRQLLRLLRHTEITESLAEAIKSVLRQINKEERNEKS